MGGFILSTEPVILGMVERGVGHDGFNGNTGLESAFVVGGQHFHCMYGIASVRRSTETTVARRCNEWQVTTREDAKVATRIYVHTNMDALIARKTAQHP